MGRVDILLGSRIKELRAGKGYTQEQAAEKLGTSLQEYARIENGGTSITLEILAKVSRALDVTVGDITRVLGETPEVAYRSGEDIDEASSEKIFEMLDLFYANKHLYMKLKERKSGGQ